MTDRPACGSSTLAAGATPHGAHFITLVIVMVGTDRLNSPRSNGPATCPAFRRTRSLLHRPNAPESRTPSTFHPLFSSSACASCACSHACDLVQAHQKIACASSDFWLKLLIFWLLSVRADTVCHRSHACVLQYPSVVHNTVILNEVKDLNLGSFVVFDSSG
ncbi:MAG: hypothetical protein UY77_C0036G0003 [Candidatus Uhrbacteria bacterium GW2011_GWA2_53_10]|uniref:Uncharacterized protein n=1 Tax=Candidatus Uhrbacteria bacterium GW2011_GWA2_53_10 TaxID=1618980 RepID=A0A0G1XLG5_9BACT|nr:MAG: hypothetical protein UY77_C0036G0003 [Candidatus Uhrbacteria bacterium GW2011_GWA2_53_10]